MYGLVEYGKNNNTRYILLFVYLIRLFFRISTATGSTAAMHAAGGIIMDIRSRK